MWGKRAAVGPQPNPTHCHLSRYKQVQNYKSSWLVPIYFKMLLNSFIPFSWQNWDNDQTIVLFSGESVLSPVITLAVRQCFCRYWFWFSIQFFLVDSIWRTMHCLSFTYLEIKCPIIIKRLKKVHLWERRNNKKVYGLVTHEGGQVLFLTIMRSFF